MYCGSAGKAPQHIGVKRPRAAAVLHKVVILGHRVASDMAAGVLATTGWQTCCTSCQEPCFHAHHSLGSDC